MGADSDRPIILFDGVCNLCERSVQLVIRNDKAAQFRFAPMQSDIARALLHEHNYEHDELSSVLLLEDGVVHRKSRAALRIARRMDRAWPLFYYAFSWLPPALADPVYTFVGNRRYKWFGKKDACWVPNEDLRRRFL